MSRKLATAVACMYKEEEKEEGTNTRGSREIPWSIIISFIPRRHQSKQATSCSRTHRCRLFLRSLPEAAKTHQPFLSSQQLDDQPETLKFEGGGAVAGRHTKHLESPGVEVKGLEEVAEQWRRARSLRCGLIM
ncbi:unnamed protein product [Linum trigynum]|uniref:Uncharacterized protein n=1 Tax=Linum trigynum TaxID=586398 RepID=A0AAV2F927_9ROSI